MQFLFLPELSIEALAHISGLRVIQFDLANFNFLIGRANLQQNRLGPNHSMIIELLFNINVNLRLTYHVYDIFSWIL